MSTALSDPAAFQRIEEDLSFLDEWEDRYRYILDLGKAAPGLDPALRTAQTKVEGCVSQVWIAPQITAGRVDFLGDSDAMLVRGLIAALHAFYAGRSASDAAAADPQAAFARLGLDQALSAQRSNGLRAMMERVRALAAAAAAG